ncbi:hypothetical protein [Streptomyces sp. NPDC052496]|uniref:hypothetical protein n=1 Tax=Streptomyces sp. NPDC052496 TaxID=3154951 RepID=UPI00343E2FCC
MTGDVRLRGMGGSMQGSRFFAVGTSDGAESVAVHTNTEFKTWQVLFRVLEAQFGIPAVPGV